NLSLFPLLFSGKVFCAVCHKRCKGDILKIEQQFVHHKCFQCTKCQKNLQQGGFFVRDQKFYCPEDYQAIFGVKCEACRTYVEGEVVTVLGKTFHTHCFQCFACRRLFSSGERTTIVDGAYYCVPCAAQITNGLGAPHGEGETLHRLSPTKSPKCLDHEGRVPVSSSTPSWSQNGSPTRFVNSSSHPQLPPSHSADGTITNGLDGSYPFVDGQLTVQVHENGFAGADSDRNKTETQLGHIGPPGASATMDTILSTTPGHTFSGVDYGRHYPISYLQLAERGFTAIMSSDEVPLQADGEAKLRTRSLIRPYTQRTTGGSRQSRRDGPRSTSSPRDGPLDRSGACAAPSDTALFAQLNGHIDSDKTRSNTFTYAGPSNYSIVGSRTPVLLSDRPRRDLYVRRRELSPGSASLGSGVIGYHARSGQTVPFTLPPGSTTPHRTGDRMSSRSTPNVRAKKGMTLLAESLVQPRPRPDRSLSPDSAAAEYWAEARRLASYPNARIPDSTSLPAIERFDFPAPPSPAVVMIEKRREKRLTGKRSTMDASNTERSGAHRDHTMDNGEPEENELTDAGLTDLPPHVSAKLHQIDAEIETLKRLGESSGITAALIQELENSKLVHIRAPDLDPVSASRSPSANTEPGYKTRYDRHVFASPSRDTRRDRRTLHSLSYRMDYTSTGGRSGTIPSFPSTPRPGYTSGVLYDRAISLPRPTLCGAGGTLVTGVQGSAATAGTVVNSPRAGAPLHFTRPSERFNYSGGVPGSGDHTLNTDESLLTSLAGFDSQGVGPGIVGSLATSALSMDGLTACSGDDTTTLAPTASSYVIKSGTMTGLPNSVTGLRPVGALLKQQSVAGRHRSRTHTPMRRTSDHTTGDSEWTDVDAYPSVQSWLRPSSTHRPASFGTYPYEQLKVSGNQIPKGLDRTRLERYLDATEFEAIFGMPLMAFQRLPEWKRNDLKKKADLI
ncbi:Villin-2, partial [Paragonimus heterotremus]